MKLSLECYSLLHGVSYLWLVMQIASPYFIWPNFARFQSEHFFKTKPRLIQYMDSIGRKTKAICWCPRFFLIVALIINFSLLAVQTDIQPYFLESVGITDTSRLAYKVLLYSPIILVSKIDITMESSPIIQLTARMVSYRPAESDDDSDGNFFAESQKL